jgi:hypothetical protein
MKIGKYLIDFFKILSAKLETNCDNFVILFSLTYGILKAVMQIY